MHGDEGILPGGGGGRTGIVRCCKNLIAWTGDDDDQARSDCADK